MQREGWVMERGRTTGRHGEKHERTSIKVLSFCCAQQSDTLQVKETESGKNRLPIIEKNREGKKRGKTSGEKPTLALSLGPPRHNDQTLSFTSAADGHQGPSTPICLLLCYSTLHLSPPFLCSPCSPPPQAAHVIGCPTELDLVLCVRDCESTCTSVCDIVQLDVNIKLVCIFCLFLFMTLTVDDGHTHKRTHTRAHQHRASILYFISAWKMNSLQDKISLCPSMGNQNVK